jgi:hypothetical protein
MQKQSKLVHYTSFDKSNPLYDIIHHPLLNVYNYTHDSQYSNGDLLFETKISDTNIIYAVHISSYMNFVEKNQDKINIHDTMNCYYPKLYSEKRFTKDELNTDKSSFKDFEKKYASYNLLINKHHDFYNNEISDELKSSHKMGIRSMHFVLYNKHNFLFPHEIFFKKVSAHEDIPFIKYNPGRNTENLYRLYSPTKDKYGRKIPFLSKSKVTRLIAKMKKNRSISLYIIENIPLQNGEVIKHPVIVDINESGYLFFQIEKLSFVDTPFLEYLTKQIVSKVTNRIIKLFDPTRSIFVDFESFKDEFIDILEIEYMIHISDKQSKLSFNNLHPFKPLLHKIRTNDQILFQYSRVSNYNKMTQIQSFIVEQFNNQSQYEDIRQKVSTQFDYSYEDTEKIIEDVIALIETDDHLSKSNTNIRKLKKIKSNGGFHVSVEYDEEKSRYYCIIKSINNIDYLHNLRIFLTNFIVCCRNEVAKEVINEYFENSITKKVDENIVAEKVEKSNEQTERAIKELTSTDVAMEEDDYDDLSNINDENALNMLQESFGNGNNGSENNTNENEIIINSKKEEHNIIQSHKENNSSVIKSNNQKGTQNNGEVQEENRPNGNQPTGNGERPLNTTAQNSNVQNRNTQQQQTPVSQIAQNNGHFSESNILPNSEEEGSDEESDEENENNSNAQNRNTQEQKTPVVQNSNAQIEQTQIAQNNGHFSESNILPNSEEEESDEESDEENENNSNAQKGQTPVAQNSNAQIEQTQIAQNNGYISESNIMSNEEEGNGTNVLPVDENFDNNESFGGAGYYFNESIPDSKIFFYDEKSIKWFKKMIGHSNFEIEEAHIKDYERVFGGSEPSGQGAMVNIMEKQESKVYGYALKLNNKECRTIEEYYKINEDKDWSFAIIFDSNGNKYKGFTFICKNEEKMNWVEYPTLNMLKQVYSLFLLSKQKIMNIYDNKLTIRGQYDGKKLHKGSIQESSMFDKMKLSDYKLSKPNPFQEKMKKLEPNIFKDTDGKSYQDYGRTCDWSQRRQPVTISEEEKERLDRDYPGSYDEIVEYSTNPKKQKNYYICPQYWNLIEHRPMKPEEVDPDTVIDPKAKKTDLNEKFVFEFRKPNQKNYKKRIPGFIDHLHPKGYYMPCCFNIKEENNKHKKMIDQAKIQMKKIEDLDTTNQKNIERFTQDYAKHTEIEKTKVTSKQKDEYIKQGSSFPLDIGRIGHLSISLEKFLHFKNNSCYMNLRKNVLKHDFPCVLRHGVEIDDKKSFLAAISFIFLKKDYTISNIIDHISQMLTIDNIIMFHNGNIPNVFYKEDELMDVDLQKYKDYDIYKKLFQSDDDNIQLRKVINGYLNFL